MLLFYYEVYNSGAASMLGIPEKKDRQHKTFFAQEAKLRTILEEE